MAKMWTSLLKCWLAALWDRSLLYWPAKFNELHNPILGHFNKELVVRPIQKEQREAGKYLVTIICNIELRTYLWNPH